MEWVIIELCHATITIKLDLWFVRRLQYLDKSGLVAESVVAVLPHAVKVGLVLPVVAVGELAILVEPGHQQIER